MPNRQPHKQTPDSGIISIIKTDTRQISTQTWLHMLDICTASSLTVTLTYGARTQSHTLTPTQGKGHRWLGGNTCQSRKHLTLALSNWMQGGLHRRFINANRQKQVNRVSHTHRRVRAHVSCTHIDTTLMGKAACVLWCYLMEDYAHPQHYGRT